MEDQDQQQAPAAEPSYDLPTQTSIRLLKITHAHIPEDGSERSVWFTICPFELADAPEYLALSYTWTDPMRPDVFSTDESAPGIFATGGLAPNRATEEEDTPAFIGERRYRATKNLRDGLAQILLSGLGRNWIWADAVCIDQTNDAEKAVQVGMMDEVYSRALAVVVWLGADTSDLDEFVWIHSEFGDALDQFIVENGVEGIRGQQGLDPEFTSRLGVLPPGGSWEGVWEGYFRFCRRRRWFSRAWIVQEVVLARRVVVLCGDKDIEWERMRLMAEMVVLLQWQSQIGVGVEEGFGRAVGDEVVRLSAAKKMIDLAMRSNTRGIEHVDDAVVAGSTSQVKGAEAEADGQKQKWFNNFLDMLLHTRVYSATDPRDKIYSLIGILKRMLPPGMDLPFRPDYSEEATPQALFTSVTSMFLRVVPDLRVLSLVEDRASRKIEGLPSWVPDYTCHLTGSPLVTVRDTVHAFNCNTSHSDLHGRPGVCRVSGNRLFVQGAEFDRIVATASPMWDVVRTQVVDDCLALCEDLSPEYLQTYTCPGEVLWRTMAADTFDGQPAPGSLATSFMSWVLARLAVQITKRTLRPDAATGQVAMVGLEEVLEEVTTRHSLDVLARLRAKEGENTPEEAESIPTTEYVLEVARQMYHIQLQLICARQGIVVVDPPIPHPSIEEAATRIEGEGAAFKHAMSPVLPFRRLYRTAKGYLGLGPASIEPGDGVYLIRGAKVPFVLRTAAAGGFELMGETYLHGFMDGEMGGRVGDDVSKIVLV